MKVQGIVDVRCPSCGKFLGEVRDYGRVVCPQCGCEVTYRSRDERRRAPRPDEQTVLAAAETANRP